MTSRKCISRKCNVAVTNHLNDWLHECQAHKMNKLRILATDHLYYAPTKGASVLSETPQHQQQQQ